MKKIIIFGLFCLFLMILGCADSGNSGETADNGNDSGDENTDTMSGENNDKVDTNDSVDSIPDDSDSEPDNSNSEPDDGNQYPCNPNPCKDIDNSTGNCKTNSLTSNYYVCECKNGYVFDGASCIKNSSDLPLCSPESKTPCIDAETALIWSGKTAEKMEWADAVDYCNNLSEGGYNDYRLPSTKVLQTLLLNCDFIENEWHCHGGAKTDGSYSKFGEIAFLWSTYISQDYEKHYGIDFLDGSLKNKDSAYARCVRKDFPDSREAKCSGLPENTTWISDTVMQTWDWDDMWTPTTEGKSIDDNENKNGCFFECTDKNFIFSNGTCVQRNIKTECKSNVDCERASYCDIENPVQDAELGIIYYCRKRQVCSSQADCPISWKCKVSEGFCITNKEADGILCKSSDDCTDPAYPICNLASGECVP